MTEYIQLDSDPQITPPYSFPGVTVRNFRVPANIFDLQALCDRYLNIGSLATRGFEYRAIFPFIDLEFLTYPRMLFDLPPYSSWGAASQQELYFKMFVGKFVLIDGWLLLPAPGITCFFPYIFVDNAWSMISGREVIGFPKLLAELHYGVAAGNPFPITAATLAIDTFAPTATLTSHEFLRIDAAAGMVQGRNRWLLLPEDLKLLDPGLQAAHALEEASDFIFLRTVHLKQFRDPGTPVDACYQAIIEGEFQAANFQLVDLPPAEIYLHSFDTLSIGPTLGLDSTMPVVPISQFGATFDLRYSRATTIFEND